MKIGDRVWVMVLGEHDFIPEECTIAHIDGDEVVVKFDRPDWTGGNLSIFDKSRVFTEKPIPEPVKKLKVIIQSVSEAVLGEYQDDYFCNKLAEQIYYEGWRK